MNYMVNWHNAPEYRYRGVVYMPHVDEQHNEDGSLDVRKVFHDIYDETKVAGDYGVVTPIFSADHSPYKFMSEDEFQYHVDMMLHECPHCGRSSIK